MSTDARYPPLGRFVDVGEIKLHCVDSDDVLADAADRPAVVMLHGNPGTVHSFAPAVFDLLGESVRCVAIDRPGHGYSDRLPDNGGSPVAQVQAIRAAVEKLGVRNPIVVGHSFGGGLALVWALLFPGEVSGLVLAEGTYYDEPRLYDKSYALLANPVLGPLVARTVGPALAGRKLPKRLATGWAPMAVPPAVQARARALWARPTVLRAIAGDVIGRAAELPALSERWAEIDLPTVIINCPDEQFVDPTRHAGRLRVALPKAEVIDVPGVGHALPDARPDVVADAVRRVAAMTTDRYR